MTNINAFFQPSSSHQVIKENKGFSIRPVSGHSIDLENFQPIARAALAYSDEDYTTKEHVDSQFIDCVYFIPRSTGV